MAASRPPAGTQWARFVMYMAGDMKEWSMDFWYSVTSGTISPTTDIKAVTTAVYSSLSAGIKNVLCTQDWSRGCIGYFNDGSGTIGTEHYQIVGGTISDQSLPEDVAVIVRKQTANLAKGGQGRWYFSMIAEQFVNGSYLTNDGITAYETCAVVFKTATTAGGLTLSPAHFSPKLNILIPIVNDPVVGLLGTRRKRRGPF